MAAQHENRGKLGGLRRNQVIRELALGEMTQRQLAEKYECSEPAITLFKRRHAEAIAAVKADAANEFAGILIAQKAARLAAYEELAEIAMVPVPRVTPAGKVVQRVNPDTGMLEEVMEVDGRLAAQVMKQAAEEMGQLPTRLQVSGEVGVRTNYTVDGVSPDDLR